MGNHVLSKRGSIMAVFAAAIGAGIISFAAIPAQSQPAPAEQIISEETTSTPNERVWTVEGPEFAKWPPTGLPKTGDAHLTIYELKTKPEDFNRVNLEDARWLQDIITTRKMAVQMDSESLSEYFDYYAEVKNTMNYFEVTFPDGSVKYVQISYSEVPK